MPGNGKGVLCFSAIGGWKDDFFRVRDEVFREIWLRWNEDPDSKLFFI